jgi:hypothetical protein
VWANQLHHLFPRLALLLSSHASTVVVPLLEEGERPGILLIPKPARPPSGGRGCRARTASVPAETDDSQMARARLSDQMADGPGASGITRLGWNTRR